MTKNLHEPSTPREVAANRYSGKMTQQRPYAYQWVTPVNVADCPADPYSLTDPRPAWTPCYLNDWERPTTLEPLSVRLSADGNLQWKGYVNSANATDSIAFIMPGTLSGEPDMIPPDDPGNLSYSVFVTPDNGGTIETGTAYIDSATGEVTISVGPCCPAWMAVYDNLYLGQTINTADGQVDLEFPYIDWSDNSADIFTYTATDLGGGNYEYLPKIKRSGIYTFSINLSSESGANNNIDLELYIYFGSTWPGKNVGHSANMIGNYDGFTNPYFYWQFSCTVPVYANNFTISPSVVLLRQSADPDFDVTLRNRMWITYHGPLSHSGAIASHNNPGPPP